MAQFKSNQEKFKAKVPRTFTMEERLQRAYNRLKAALTYYMTCAHLHKKRKQPLPSKQELDDRSPAAGKNAETAPPFSMAVESAAHSTTTAAVQETAVKVQTPYWAIRQRLPKTAIIYEESLAPNTGRRPNRPDHQNSNVATTAAYKSIDSYKIGRPCLPPLERRSCSLKSHRASISTIASDPRTSICSLDAYKIINTGGSTSRRTSGYSTGRSSEMEIGANGDSGKIVFEELDGYKQLIDPRRLQNHEYANLKGQKV